MKVAATAGIAEHGPALRSLYTHPAIFFYILISKCNVRAWRRDFFNLVATGRVERKRDRKKKPTTNYVGWTDKMAGFRTSNMH